MAVALLSIGPATLIAATKAYGAHKMPYPYFDFVVIGLPGSGTCFWSQVLSEGSKSYCSHEFFPGENRVKALIQGDSSSRWLAERCITTRKLLVVRDPDECLKSVLRRYPSYGEEFGREVVNDMATGMESLLSDEGTDIMKLDWHPRFTCTEIRDVFKFCVEADMCKARANLFSEINITKAQ